ncbi:hypothetical protein TNCV_85841 [Trichonephila clavipes]|nr:hypothetical protein TNCV_85841 [Trichonephila clavipes]
MNTYSNEELVDMLIVTGTLLGGYTRNAAPLSGFPVVKINMPILSNVTEIGRLRHETNVPISVPDQSSLREIGRLRHETNIHISVPDQPYGKLGY